MCQIPTLPSEVEWWGSARRRRARAQCEAVCCLWQPPPFGLPVLYSIRCGRNESGCVWQNRPENAKKPEQSSIRGYTNPVKITVRYSVSQMSDCSGLSRIARDPMAPSDSSMNRFPLSPRWGFPALPAIVLGHRFQWDAGLTLAMGVLWAALPPPGITGYRSQPPFSVGCAAYSSGIAYIFTALSEGGMMTHWYPGP